MNKIFSTGMGAGSRSRLTMLIGYTLTVAAGSIQFILFLELLHQHSVYSTTESNATNELTQTYENLTANIKIQYPAEWMAETKTANPESYEIVRIFPKELMAEQYPNVSFVVSFIPKEVATAIMGKPNLTRLSELTLAGIEAAPDFRLINSSLHENVSISFVNGTEPKSIPAFVMHLYDFLELFVDMQEMNIGFIVNDNIVYFVYDAAQKDFAKYLPQALKMIDSVQLLNNTTK